MRYFDKIAYKNMFKRFLTGKLVKKILLVSSIVKNCQIPLRCFLQFLYFLGVYCYDESSMTDRVMRVVSTSTIKFRNA